MSSQYCATCQVSMILRIKVELEKPYLKIQKIEDVKIYINCLKFIPKNHSQI